MTTRDNPRRTVSGSPLRRHIVAALGTAVMGAMATWVYSGAGSSSSGPALAAATTSEAVATVSVTTVAPAKPADPFPKQIAPLLKTYCNKCHGPGTDNAGVRLDKYASTKDLLADRKVWTKVLQYLELGAMPPPDFKNQPDAKQRRQIVKYLDKTLFAIDCDMVRDPGRVTIRRLNRSEYNNTIRDLIGVDFQPAKTFPSDDVGEGFDNIGDVLSVSPLLIEKYLDAAEQISSKAIVSINPFETRNKKLANKAFNSNANATPQGNGSLGLYSKGHVGTTVEFPSDGNYILRVNGSADQAGPDPARLALSLSGTRLATLDIKSKNRGDRKNIDHKLKATKGRWPLRLEFINDYYKPKAADPKLRGDRNAYVFSLEVIGPLDIKPADLPASHLRLIAVSPNKQRSAREAALSNLAPLMRRAYRRPVTVEEITRIADFVAASVKQGETFEEAMRLGLQAVLVSPHFLFRIENDLQPGDPKKDHPLSDFELATRLSYFLWSSLPDDELFRLAEQKRLHQPKVLEKQVRRMIADPRGNALVENFAAQWLNLRILDEITPDPKKFPEFNEPLREAMKQETKLFFAEVMKKDLSITEFLDGHFTFVNEPLAKLYGIPGVTGSAMRRIDLPADRRAGVLTHASILTLTSNPDRTSPVKRGKWIMENILDSPPPPPPPNVPEFEVTAKAAPDASLRKQLEIHREKASCAICHRQMDALGFGFENFDAIGRWRDKDGSHPIDSSGSLPSTETFSGVIELIGILKKRKSRFCRSLTRKMLIFSLGRGLEFYDRCAVDKIIEACRKDDYRFSALVISIVQSEPFRRRRAEGAKQ